MPFAIVNLILLYNLWGGSRKMEGEGRVGERWDQEREERGTNVGKERKTYPPPPSHPPLTPPPF